MPEGDGPTINVDLVGIETQFSNHAERLRGEMLALATQNGELRLINDQLQKSGEGARAGGMNGRV